MKKLLLLFAPLLFVHPAHSDNRTSQEPYLCVITTGVADTKRSYGDKINDNFRILSATLSNTNATINSLSSSLNPSSYTMQGNNVDITTTAKGVNALYQGQINASSYTLQGNSVNISSVASGLNNAIQRLEAVSASTGITISSSGLYHQQISSICFVVGDGPSRIVIGVSSWTIYVTSGTGAGGGGGGSSTIYTSTKTLTLRGDGSPYTAKFTSSSLASYSIGRTTWNIIDVQVGYDLKISTTNQDINFTTFSIIVATRAASQANGVDLSPIHSSSFTIGGGDINVRSPWETNPVVPDTITRILAFKRLYLWCDTLTPAGERPEGWWVKIRYWEEP